MYEIPTRVLITNSPERSFLHICILLGVYLSLAVLDVDQCVILPLATSMDRPFTEVRSAREVLYMR